jgi:hypothetical protein
MTGDRPIRMEPTGYASSTYARSLSGFGAPFQLPRSRAWLLKRPIPGSSDHDAMWTYPLLACVAWRELHLDLDALQGQLVSACAVTDPFGEYDLAYLQTCFRDVVLPFKQHFIVDLSRPPERFVDPHHRRNARKGLDAVTVEQCGNTENVLEDWIGLYDNLIERHQIKGLVAFSRDSFATQFTAPGLVVFRALREATTVGMSLWYVQNDIGYYHLGAYSAEGYRFNASFALFWTVLEYFAGTGIRWLSLGAGAGSRGNDQDGLTRFKSGWSTETRTAFFCGRILDPERYQALVSGHNAPATDFFPAYRVGQPL